MVYVPGVPLGYVEVRQRLGKRKAEVQSFPRLGDGCVGRSDKRRPTENQWEVLSRVTSKESSVEDTGSETKSTGRGLRDS